MLGNDGFTAFGFMVLENFKRDDVWV